MDPEHMPHGESLPAAAEEHNKAEAQIAAANADFDARQEHVSRVAEEVQEFQREEGKLSENIERLEVQLRQAQEVICRPPSRGVPASISCCLSVAGAPLLRAAGYRPSQAVPES